MGQMLLRDGRLTMAWDRWACSAFQNEQLAKLHFPCSWLTMSLEVVVPFRAALGSAFCLTRANSPIHVVPFARLLLSKGRVLATRETELTLKIRSTPGSSS